MANLCTCANLCKTCVAHRLGTREKPVMYPPFRGTYHRFCTAFKLDEKDTTCDSLLVAEFMTLRRSPRGKMRGCRVAK